jgi:hypothetical protein
MSPGGKRVTTYKRKSLMSMFLLLSLFLILITRVAKLPLILARFALETSADKSSSVTEKTIDENKGAGD